MSQSALTESAGCFGKLPGRGDFIVDRLPNSFVEPWDTFLRSFVASSRDALGDDWPDRYLNGPIWRFALSPGLAGPNAVIGTLMPSVDRIGRYFPMTIAQVLCGTPLISGEDPWFDRAEALSMETLNDEFDPRTFTARLHDLGSPKLSFDEAPLSDGFWWTLGGETLPSLAFRGAALPRGQAATTLLDGDWQRWGWSVQRLQFGPRPEETGADDARAR
jgi:type VI secretion system protein ImpM